MGQMIYVKALEREGYLGVHRADRLWSHEGKRIEVLDQDDDPPKVDKQVIKDDKTVTIKVHDPDRIGRRTFEAIKADARIKILADGETNEVEHSAALDEARRIADEKHQESVSLRLENADLRQENEDLREKVAQLEGHLASLGQPPAPPTVPSMPPGPTPDEMGEPEIIPPAHEGPEHHAKARRGGRR